MVLVTGEFSENAQRGRGGEKPGRKSGERKEIKEWVNSDETDGKSQKTPSRFVDALIGWTRREKGGSKRPGVVVGEEDERPR